MTRAHPTARPPAALVTCPPGQPSTDTILAPAAPRTCPPGQVRPSAILAPAAPRTCPPGQVRPSATLAPAAPRTCPPGQPLRALTPLALLLTCLTGQACTPVVYELATAGHDSSTGKPDPEPTDGDQPTAPPEPGDSDGFADCKDGQRNGDESDIDCGGPCLPCGPGQACQSPKDCLLPGLCLGGACTKPACLFPGDCPDPGPCHTVQCTEFGACEVTPADDGQPCDDGDPCTLKDSCLAGKCSAAATLECDKLDGPCRKGICNPLSGNCAVEWVSEGQPCDDERACTMNELCVAGECLAPEPPPALLATDFSVVGDWKTAPPWEIGPAAGSPCGPPFADDPPQDHSKTEDNSLAGAVIGGCLPIDPFPESCLESPFVDATKLEGPLELRFWSVLNTAESPMLSRVDVFAAEKKLWVPLLSFDAFLAEPGWSEHVLDLTPFKGPALRVRFCHESTGKSFPMVGGWSIDDLSIAPPPCGP